MSDQADGLRQWMKKSRAASLARDPGGERKNPPHLVLGRNDGGAEMADTGDSLREFAVAGPRSLDSEQGGEETLREAAEM